MKETKYKLSIEIYNDNNLGIPFIVPDYIEVKETQDRNEEYSKIIKTLDKYKEHYAKNHNVDISKLGFQFINYGKTELVFVLIKEKEICETILLKQPGVEMGAVKKEAENLTELKKRDEHVVAPLEYFQFEDQELYTTPYLYQARCIAGYNGYWGMYIPEPIYRFECFPEEISEMVSIGMIAKLVSLYDHEKQKGIGACRLSGGDFMFPKDWDKNRITIDSIFNHLYLIAAREMMEVPFEEYLNILRREFKRYTIKEDPKNTFINIRGRAIISEENIEKGIRLGIEISKGGNPNNPQKTYHLEQK